MRGRIALGSAMGVMALGLTLFWTLYRGPAPADVPSPQAPVVELAPARTVRGARILRQRAGWVRRHPLTSPELRGVQVPVGDPRVRVRALSLEPSMGPESSLPSLGEAPWPRGEASELLQQALVDGSDEAELSFMQAAQRRRLDPTQLEVAADPWRAVLALELERRRALKKAEGEDKAVGRWMLRLAEEVVRLHPDSAVADHAWLYRLHALGDPRWDTFDAAGAGRAAVTALRSSGDRLVTAVATAHLGKAASSGLDLSEDLDGLWDDGHTDVWLASAAVDHALASARWSDAEQWLRRLSDRVDLTCQPPAGTKDTPSIQKPTCQAWRQDLRWAWGQVRAVQGTDAMSWREQVPLAAWKCHLWGSQRAPGSRVTGSGRFEQGVWTWTRWQGADQDFDACFEAEMHFGVRPDKDVSVDVVVVRDR